METGQPSSRMFCLVNFVDTTGLQRFRSSRREVFCKQQVRQFHRKTPVPVSLVKQSCRPRAYYFIKKETLAEVFSCSFSSEYL